jgi:hypothetical protein
MAITNTPALGNIPLVDRQLDDTFAIQTGQLTSNVVGVVTWGISGVTAVNGVATKVGTYGTYQLNTTTGLYTFTPNDAAIEATTGGVLATLAGNGINIFAIEAGATSADFLIGFAVTETLGAGSTSDTLGNDTLVTLAVDQKFAGLAGDDNYTIAATHTGTVITEAVNGGTDTVTTSVDYTLAANIENLTIGLTGIVGTGNELANRLTGLAGATTSTLIGAAGNDTLISLTGNDSLAGGAGDDSYTIDNTADTVTELTGEGWDAVTTSVTGVTLATNAEVLILGAGALAGTGNAGNNYLLANSVGAATNNTLNGGTGAAMTVTILISLTMQVT